MVWAAFTHYGKFGLIFTSSRMKGAEYVEILRDKLLPWVCFAHRIPFIYQQNNASIHKSRATAWFNSEGINVLPWPACSPDLNPVENLWIAKLEHRDDKQSKLNMQADASRDDAPYGKNRPAGEVSSVSEDKNAKCIVLKVKACGLKGYMHATTEAVSDPGEVDIE